MNTVAKPMDEWETINWAKAQRYVLKLQKRIYRASASGDVKAVRKLQRLLTKSWYSKIVALKTVSQDPRGDRNPEIDGISHRRDGFSKRSDCLWQCEKRDRFAGALHHRQQVKLSPKLTFTNQSLSLVRVKIPKSGKIELIRLGIPTIEARAKQALFKLALEPEWEAKFEPNSYGFRPGKSEHDAISAIGRSIYQKAKYVLQADIEQSCDQINRSTLLDKLQTSPTFRKQIKAWLKSGVMDGKALFPTNEGTSHRTVISPLLANIALDGIENLLTEKFSNRLGRTNAKEKISFVRYGDTFLLMDESLEVILEAKAVVEKWLAEIGLTLKANKTRISHTLASYQGNIGFDFLGFHIRQYPCREKRSGSMGETAKKREYKTLIKPSKEAIQKHLKKIDYLLNQNIASSQEQTINSLNPVIREWAEYYSTLANAETFRKLDNILWQKLFGWAKRRRGRDRNNTDVVSKYWGVNRGLGWKFVTQDNRCILAKHQDTKTQRYCRNVIDRRYLEKPNH